MWAILGHATSSNPVAIHDFMCSIVSWMNEVPKFKFLKYLGGTKTGIDAFVEWSKGLGVEIYPLENPIEEKAKKRKRQS
jgi:hypothetical protein